MGKFQSKITGILLAGGKSKRMGHEKGNIVVRNAKLFEYPLSVLEKVCDEVLISTCSGLPYPEKHQSICDEIKGIGPMGGIYSCLRKSSSDLNLVLSYDMPMVSHELLTYLLDEWNEEEVLLPAHDDGRPEPLCGLYRKSAFHALEDLIAQEIYSVHSVLSQTKSRTLEITEDLKCWHPDLFLNVNREEDLKKILPGISLKRDEN